MYATGSQSICLQIFLRAVQRYHASELPPSQEKVDDVFLSINNGDPLLPPFDLALPY